MPSIHENNRAAALLSSLVESDGLSVERLALLTGVAAATLVACRDQKTPLPLAVQSKLARSIVQRVPRLARKARQLEEQASAALRMEVGSTSLHLTAPPKWW